MTRVPLIVVGDRFYRMPPPDPRRAPIPAWLESPCRYCRSRRSRHGSRGPDENRKTSVRTGLPTPAPARRGPCPGGICPRLLEFRVGAASHGYPPSVYTPFLPVGVARLTPHGAHAPPAPPWLGRSRRPAHRPRPLSGQHCAALPAAR